MGIPDPTVQQLGNADALAAHDFQLVNQILDEFKDSEPFNYDFKDGDGWAQSLIYRALEIGRKEGSQENIREPKPLTDFEARSLTSREIAKIIAGIMGSLASWCDVDQIFDALDNLHKYREQYRSQFNLMKRLAEGMNTKR